MDTRSPRPEPKKPEPSRAVVLSTVIATFFAAGLAPAGARSDDSPTLRDLAGFAGCWRTEGVGYTEEIWSAPTSNLMLGLTLFVREGRAVEYELTRVEAAGDRIVMTPYPNGIASAHPFVLTSLRDGVATFEAPEHDYPKRILYRANADGSRTARIDGGETDAGGQEWRFRRVACPGT
jgi:hypothetical protein